MVQPVLMEVVIICKTKEDESDISQSAHALLDVVFEDSARGPINGTTNQLRVSF